MSRTKSAPPKGGLGPPSDTAGPILIVAVRGCPSCTLPPLVLGISMAMVDRHNILGVYVRVPDGTTIAFASRTEDGVDLEPIEPACHGPAPKDPGMPPWA